VYDPNSLEMLEPRHEHIRADARQALGEIAEPQRAKEQVTDDERRPTVSDQVERRRDAAQLGVTAGRRGVGGHAAIVSPDFQREIRLAKCK
jgi:hypothetical protein